MKLNHLDEVTTVVRDLMCDFGAPWCIAGGWAVDLYLGRTTRPHADLELAVLRRDQSKLHRQFPGWTFNKVVSGDRENWTAEQRLELPVHEVHARSDSDSNRTLEFLLNEGDAENWVFRRNSRVSMPLSRAFSQAIEPPYLAPEIVLLFKAKDPRDKDKADFITTLPQLEEPRQRWLSDAITTCHPGHPWLKALAR